MSDYKSHPSKSFAHFNSYSCTEEHSRLEVLISMTSKVGFGDWLWKMSHSENSKIIGLFLTDLFFFLGGKLSYGLPLVNHSARNQDLFPESTAFDPH